jgi:hypothetical protein
LVCMLISGTNDFADIVDTRKIFLKIDVDDPKRSIYTYAKKRTEDHSWTFSQTEAFRMYVNYFTGIIYIVTINV